MATEHPIDISSVPELLRLAEDVRATRRPRVLRRAHEDSAVLVPLPVSQRPATRSDRTTAAALTAVERTAGMFQSAAKQPPATIAEETAAF
jgi:hypothetical protein